MSIESGTLGRSLAGGSSLIETGLDRLDPGMRILAGVGIPRAQAVAIGGGEVWVLPIPDRARPPSFYAVKHTAALGRTDGQWTTLSALILGQAASR